MLRAPIPKTMVISVMIAATTFQYLPSATPSHRQNRSIRIVVPLNVEVTRS
jgi:hypothetical protein